MKYAPLVKAAALATTSILLVACDGGAGGPGGPNGTSFLSFDKMQTSGTTTIKGTGREVSYTADTSTQTVKSVGDFTHAAPVTADATLDASGDISAVKLDTGTTKANWDSSNATQTSVGKFIKATTNDKQNTIAFADTGSNGFDYQTFGAWKTGIETGSGSMGAFSVGSPTATAAIPTTASAIFTGTAGGFVVNKAGDGASFSADATLDANFAKRTMGFTTANSTLFNGAARPGLDMNGSMTYAAGSNSMSGNVSAQNGMSGDMQGQFYGPAAQEVGGTFALKGKGNGTAAMGGGFGAKR
jgi:hypothetical protein